jgi:hypothetical protein
MRQAVGFRCVALTVVTILVTVPLPAVAGPRAPVMAPTSVGRALGDLIARSRAWAEQLVPEWGCTMDPNGRCLNAVTPSWGCGADPNGSHCPLASAPSAAAQAGRRARSDRR